MLASQQLLAYKTNTHTAAKTGHLYLDFALSRAIGQSSCLKVTLPYNNSFKTGNGLY